MYRWMIDRGDFAVNANKDERERGVIVKGSSMYDDLWIFMVFTDRSMK